MSILGRLKNMFVQKIVDDEFYQPITEHEIYAVLNKKGSRQASDSKLKLQHTASTVTQHDALAVAEALSQHTPEMEFRMLGYEPSLETISAKVGSLKAKLQVIDAHLLENYPQYLLSINRSLQLFEQGREFYATRRKVSEARFLLQKMSKMLGRSKSITRLNITIKNLKTTLKLLEKVPNIKKMGLVELKAIDLQKLNKTNEVIGGVYGQKLLCLTNLSKYILKVNQQSFAYIINNLNMCLDSYDSHLYEEIMRSYLIIQPPITLDQLLAKFLQERIRSIFQGNDSLSTLGNRLISLMISLHKIIKWHIINKALKNSHRSNIEGESEEHQRRLSVSSNNSEEAPSTIELGEIVYIGLEGIKDIFSRSVDSSLADFSSDFIFSTEQESKEVYSQLQVLAKIAQICSNFTGRRLQKLRKTFLQHFNRKESVLFTKSGKELVSSIEQQKGDWNRLAFPNNFRFAPIDRLLYRWTRMQEIDDHRRIVNSINRLFSEEELSLFSDECESQQEEALELKIVRMDSIDRLEKKFQDWIPKGYLQLYEGDVIVCQSSYKLLGILQRYTEFLMYAPSSRHTAYFEHMLFLIEYVAYFIFNSLLSAKYRSLFFEPTNTDTPLEKAYTLKRFRTLYPRLATFVVSFRSNLQQADPSVQANRLYSIFRKDIREASGQENQVLRAKVVATDACKYCLAYFQQILKASGADQSEAGKVLFARAGQMRSILQELCVLLLTQSSQNMVGVQLQTIRSFFQSMRWYQAYEDLREYVQKIVGIVRESFQRLKGCHRGEIPLSTLHFVFVFVWRTILTYSVKLFLQGKGNNRRDNKLNFQKFVDDLYLAFDSPSFPALTTAYSVFKSIFRILLSNQWDECRQLLVENLRKFDYIYPILMSILENSEYMATLSEKQKDSRRAQIRQEIDLLLKDIK